MVCGCQREDLHLHRETWRAAQNRCWVGGLGARSRSPESDPSRTQGGPGGLRTLGKAWVKSVFGSRECFSSLGEAEGWDFRRTVGTQPPFPPLGKGVEVEAKGSWHSELSMVTLLTVVGPGHSGLSRYGRPMEKSCMCKPNAGSPFS